MTGSLCGLPLPLAATVLIAAIALGTVVVASDPSVQVLAVAVASIATFALRSLPDATTALFIFLAFLAIGLAPVDVIFSGFAASGFWLLIGGLIIGSAIATSGLGDQIAARIHAHTGASYVRAIWILSLGGVVLGLFVPSAIPRVIVMMPVTLALAKSMGLSTGSRGHTGLLVTAAIMTLVPTYAFLTANLPTIVELGAIEILYGQQISYGDYFVQNAPINAVRFVVLIALLLAFGRGSQVAAPAPQTDTVSLTAPQRRILWILGIAILFWASDGWHGIAPAWISLAAGTVMLLPALGVFAPGAMRSDIDLSVAFLIAAVFCVSAVMTEVGLGQQIADIIVPALGLQEGDSFRNLIAITGFSSGLSHFTIAPATPIVLAPLAQSMSDATGWSINTVAMAHNIGFSTTFLPYQSPPLLIGIAMAQIPVGALTRICLVSAVITCLVGLPLTWVWWTWLGLV